MQGSPSRKKSGLTWPRDLGRGASDILGDVVWRAPFRTIVAAACLGLLNVGAVHAEDETEPAVVPTDPGEDEAKPDVVPTDPGEDEAKPIVAPADTGEDEIDDPVFADRFAGSYILLEHSGSVGHGGDLSPGATYAFVQSWAFSLAFDADDYLSFSASLGVDTELTPTDTTFSLEPLVSDLDLAAGVALPMPPGVEDILGWQVDLTASLPTSKASESSSLIVALEPALSASVTAPVLDGLSFDYGVGAIPYFHRYTTSSTLTPRACSPAAGCDLGRTTDTGGRNTAFQLRLGIDVGLSALKDRLSVGLGFQALYSWLHALSPSSKYSEETLLNPGNGDGSPTTVTTEFTAEIGIQPQPGLALAVGLWTPGGLRPDGGYYNPFANRFSTIYLDLTFYPVAGIAHAVRLHQKNAQAANNPAP